MKKILLAFMMALSFNAMALDTTAVGSAGFNDLSDTQKAEIIQLVAQKAAVNTGTIGTTADQANEWLNIGERIGKGFAGAAKELGIAANQFAETPVGKWVAFLIIWHFFGSMAIHVSFALLFLIIGIMATRYVTNRMRDCVITYNKEKTNWFGNHPKLSEKYDDLTEGGTFIMLLMIVGTAIITIATAFSAW